MVFAPGINGLIMTIKTNQKSVLSNNSYNKLNVKCFKKLLWFFEKFDDKMS